MVWKYRLRVLGALPVWVQITEAHRDSADLDQ